MICQCIKPQSLAAAFRRLAGFNERLGWGSSASYGDPEEIGLGQKLRKSEPREPLEIRLEDRVLSGSYTLSSGMVHVISLYGRKSIQLDGTPPNVLAERLFQEIVQEAAVGAGHKR